MVNDWDVISNENINTEKDKINVIKSKKSLFVPSKDIVKNQNIKIAIYGNYSTGKSYFSLTAPGTIFVIDTEDGVTPILNNFEGKDIRIVKLNEIDKKKYESDGTRNYEKLKEILMDISNLSQEDKPKTIVVDSISDLYNMIQDYIKVDFYSLKPEEKFKYQFDWGKVNNVHHHIIQKLISQNVNIILTGKAGKDYDAAGKVIPGSFSPKWHQTVPFMADVVIYNNLGYDVKTKQNTFVSTIKKCRINNNIAGKQYVNLNWDMLIDEINK